MRRIQFSDMGFLPWHLGSRASRLDALPSCCRGGAKADLLMILSLPGSPALCRPTAGEGEELPLKNEVFSFLGVESGISSFDP